MEGDPRRAVILARADERLTGYLGRRESAGGTGGMSGINDVGIAVRAWTTIDPKARLRRLTYRESSLSRRLDSSARLGESTASFTRRR